MLAASAGCTVTPLSADPPPTTPVPVLPSPPSPRRTTRPHRTGTPQTGSGKTFTQSGDPRAYQHRGIIPRAIHHIFKEVDMRVDKIYKVWVRQGELDGPVGAYSQVCRGGACIGAWWGRAECPACSTGAGGGTAGATGADVCRTVPLARLYRLTARTLRSVLPLRPACTAGFLPGAVQRPDVRPAG